jgi:hypothetical protein
MGPPCTAWAMSRHVCTPIRPQNLPASANRRSRPPPDNVKNRWECRRAFRSARVPAPWAARHLQVAHKTLAALFLAFGGDPMGRACSFHAMFDALAGRCRPRGGLPPRHFVSARMYDAGTCPLPRGTPSERPRVGRSFFWVQQSLPLAPQITPPQWPPQRPPPWF